MLMMVSHQNFEVIFTAPSIPVAHRQRVCEDFSKVDMSASSHNPISDNVSIAGVDGHLLKQTNFHLLTLSSRSGLHLSMILVSQD